jgi:hypothetical protein
LNFEQKKSQEIISQSEILKNKSTGIVEFIFLYLPLKHLSRKLLKEAKISQVNVSVIILPQVANQEFFPRSFFFSSTF